MSVTKRTKGKTPLATQLDTDLVEAFRSFCAARGQTLSYHLDLAVRRHMANPPPVFDVPALPPVTVVAPVKPVEPAAHVKPRGRPRKS